MYMDNHQVVKYLKKGSIGVIPTDTIYGIVGSALDSQVVEKIYVLRKRSKDKPMIILISSIKDLDKFNIKLSEKQKNFLENNWPNPLSVVLSCSDDKFKYLHRGKNSLAFRMPKDINLLELLEKVGPLVAPSANFEGEKSAENIEQAKKYFKNNIDFYMDGGTVNSLSSTLVGFDKDTIKILRQGNFKI
jgi:L-threonylcarbamoyladenylate synthase